MLNLVATRKVYISRILIRCKNESIEARTIVTVILYIEIFIKFSHAMVEILPGSGSREQKRPCPAHVILTASSLHRHGSWLWSHATTLHRTNVSVPTTDKYDRCRCSPRLPACLTSRVLGCGSSKVHQSLPTQKRQIHMVFPRLPAKTADPHCIHKICLVVRLKQAS